MRQIGVVPTDTALTFIVLTGTMFVISVLTVSAVSHALPLHSPSLYSLSLHSLSGSCQSLKKRDKEELKEAITQRFLVKQGNLAPKESGHHRTRTHALRRAEAEEEGEEAKIKCKTRLENERWHVTTRF